MPRVVHVVRHSPTWSRAVNRCSLLGAISWITQLRLAILVDAGGTIAFEAARSLLQTHLLNLVVDVVHEVLQ